VSISLKEACVGTMDGACTWREGERVNEASSRSPNDLELVSRARRSKQALDAETARWNALEVLLDIRLTRADVVRPSVSGKWVTHRIWYRASGVGSGERLRESVKMVHRACPEATHERERLGCSWQRQI